MSSETDRGKCSISRRLRADAADLWELMWRPEGQGRWLGPGARVRLRRDAHGLLGDETGVTRRVRTLRIDPRFRLALAVEPPVAWPAPGETRASIAVSEHQDGGAVVEVIEQDVPLRHLSEVERYWNSRLDRLKSLVGQIQSRRQATRQALVVIHGIGEQEPGDTLRSLLRSGAVTADEAAEMWVKPDPVSGSYEMRRVTLSASERRPTTDVFEFYWAHIIRDTTMAQLGTWLRRLLWRWRVPGPLRPIWILCWLLALAILATTVAWLAGAAWPARWFATGTVAAVAAGLIWRFGGKAMTLDVIGDAARYLMPHPANIAHRQAIRRQGVDLLKRLHECGQYDRIVVLGHSLGSVIAYDVITYAWAELHNRHRLPSAPDFGDVRLIERSLGETAAERARVLQHSAWKKCRRNTQPWLVTDLVTAGSPLAHADLLMARNPTEFASAKAHRVLPSCPPAAEIEKKSGHRRVTFDRPYGDPLTGQNRTFTLFHHAAPFAVTRWTNLYFKVGHLGLSGDLVGGPVADLFGHWVQDMALDSPTRGVAHTWYWRRSKRSSAHIEALHDALDLEHRAELAELLEEIPAYCLLPGQESE